MEMTLKKISQPSIFFEMNSLKFIEMNTSGAIPLKKYKLPGPAYIDKDPEIPKEKHEI